MAFFRVLYLILIFFFSSYFYLISILSSIFLNSYSLPLPTTFTFIQYTTSFFTLLSHIFSFFTFTTYYSLYIFLSISSSELYTNISYLPKAIITDISSCIKYQLTAIKCRLITEIIYYVVNRMKEFYFNFY